MKQDVKGQTMAQRQDEFMDDSNIKCLYATDKFWGILVFTMLPVL
jgi:hypothetical protein